MLQRRKGLLPWLLLGPGLIWLVLIAVINSAISAYYYIKIVRAMYRATEVDASLLPAIEPDVRIEYEVVVVASAETTSRSGASTSRAAPRARSSRSCFNWCSAISRRTRTRYLPAPSVVKFDGPSRRSAEPSPPSP